MTTAVLQDLRQRQKFLSIANVSWRVERQNRQEENRLQKRLSAIEKSKVLSLRHTEAKMKHFQLWSYRLNIQASNGDSIQGSKELFLQGASVITQYCTCRRCLKQWQSSKQWAMRVDAEEASPSTRSTAKDVSVSVKCTKHRKMFLNGQSASSTESMLTLSSDLSPVESNATRLPIRDPTQNNKLPHLQHKTDLVKDTQSKNSKAVAVVLPKVHDEELLMSTVAFRTASHKGSRHVSNTSFRTIQMARNIQTARKLIRPQTMPAISGTLRTSNQLSLTKIGDSYSRF